jgi:photosystem II stability/assembly factor-like uncharacterized protein
MIAPVRPTIAHPRSSQPASRRIVSALSALPLLAGLGALLASGITAHPVAAQRVDPGTFSALRWRLVGPFRAGRCVTAAGVPGQPDLSYFGSVGGGVWKTVDAGRTWSPIFDGEPVGSIGAIAVAPSDPSVIYVGSGEADMRSQISYGNGMYRSDDGGMTWVHIGLEDTRQIGRVLVDPHDPNLVYVAALGHAYGPNEQRGVFRSTDGGRSWQKVLFENADTGAIDLAFDPRDRRVIYAALWQTRRPPWNIYPPSNGPGSGLYKSINGGDTWRRIAGHGLPSAGLGRIGIAVAPTEPDRVYLIVDADQGGLYRSDDAGASWRLIHSATRIWQRGWYFGAIAVDPKDADTVYVLNTAMYRSTDGGSTFTSIKGAPGGDDYHFLWIDPDHPERMIVATDQGTVVTVDGGATWSSWYNQPTAQLYHVAAGNGFPYQVYGAQQDSGAVAIPTRSSHRAITFRDWEACPVGGENGYLAPDPLDPDVVYGGTVERWDRRSGEVQDVSPTLAYPGDYRRTWTLPLVFSERDPHQLYFANQFLFRTSDGGQSWQKLSPDLSRDDPGVPPNLDPPTVADAPAGKRRGVIYSIAPSPLRAGEIWVGTDDGLIQVTRDDGKMWRDVTPEAITAWSKVAMLVASRHDPDTVYAAVDRHRLEDYRPYLYRTRDGGATWQNVTTGISDDDYLNCVREDPVREGLLFAGTEMGVYVSFDDGDNWQSLQLNLPAVSVRDLAIHEGDLIAATHGRSFWVLDDMTPLREAGSEVTRANAYLFSPRPAWRERRGSDNGTPVPKEEAAAENPPPGASIDYYLKSTPNNPVVLEILDGAGKTVRRFASDERPRDVNPAALQFESSWAPPAHVLPAAPGMHRWMWDLHWTGRAGVEARPAGWHRGGNSGPWALPGEYTVRLTVDGAVTTRPLTVKMDPRVKSPAEHLAAQLRVSMQITEAQDEVATAIGDTQSLLEDVRSARRKVTQAVAAAEHALDALEEKLEAILGSATAGFQQRPGPAPAPPDLSSLRHAAGELDELYRVVQGADVAPSPDAITGLAKALAVLHEAEVRLDAVRTEDLPRVNALLTGARLAPIAAHAPPADS